MNAETYMGKKVDDAAREWENRKQRNTNPEGTFDNAGRWYPDDDERQECCDSVRGPSRSYPYSYMTHCRTAAHVAAVCGVELVELKAAHRLLFPPAKQEAAEHHTAWKAVAVRADGSLASIFDDEVTYEIGKTRCEKVRDDHGGGYYVRQCPVLALTAPVPDESDNAGLPRRVVRCEVWGRHVDYGTSKSAWTYCRPTAMVK